MADRAALVGLSVWPLDRQRAGQPLPGVSRPDQMPPDLATRVIAAWTVSGDIVLDPIAGTGTSCVAAVRLGRHTIGIEPDLDRARLATAHLARAWASGATGGGMVLSGDTTTVLPGLAPVLVGRVALVLAYLPHRRAARGGGLPVSAGTERVETVLGGCVPLLRPGGMVVLVVRERRVRGRLVDTPAAVTVAAYRAGLAPVERCVALLTALPDGRPEIQRGRVNHRAARRDGPPLHRTVHADVLAFTAAPHLARSAAASMRPVVGLRFGRAA